MLSPMIEERIAPQANKFWCDCCPECTDSFILPKLLGDMIMGDKTLFMIVGKHPVPAGAAEVKKGKGWKIYRLGG
jgi:hypothetical protein